MKPTKCSTPNCWKTATKIVNVNEKTLRVCSFCFIMIKKETNGHNFELPNYDTLEEKRGER